MIKISKDLKRHAREFVDALRNLKFEKNDFGLYFPMQGALIQAHGLYEHGVNGKDWRLDANLLPTEGLTYLMSLLGAGTKLTPWYIALYSGAYTPTSGLTAANFTSTTTEITSGSEGYTESTRVTWTPGTAASGSINNTASPAAFTIITASTLTVNGVGMLSASAKGATTGTLVSATRFSAARSLNNTDVFQVKYTLSLTSS